MKVTSIIPILKSSNAVLCVLALALIAQMPHAADVFRLTVHGDANIWSFVHSYSYAVALELAVLLFVIQNRHIESYGFAAVSVLVNLSYYSLHGVNLFGLAAFPAYLVSIALPVAIALYSHAVVDSEPTEQQPQAKRVTRTVRNTQTVEQSEQFVVPAVQPELIMVVQSESDTARPTNYTLLSDSEKKEQFAIVLSSEVVPSKAKLSNMFGVSRTTVYAWIREIEQAKENAQ